MSQSKMCFQITVMTGLKQFQTLFVVLVIFTIMIMTLKHLNINGLYETKESIISDLRMKKFKCDDMVATKPVIECPMNMSRFVSVIDSGRLGNKMFNYAGLVIVARLYDLVPFIPACILIDLENYFVNLTIPIVDTCDKKQEQNLISWTEWNMSPAKRANHGLMLGPWFQDVDIFSKYLNKARDIFVFNDSLIDYASQQLDKAALRFFDKLEPETVFVGVHVRRTDYKHFLWLKHDETLAGASYFFGAMKYFHEKFDRTVFVVMSDDLIWCLKNLKSDKYRVYINENRKSSPGEDLAVLSRCNHSIFDYGTFGAWGAILSRGEVIAYNISKEHSTQIASALNWKLLRA